MRQTGTLAPVIFSFVLFFFSKGVRKTLLNILEENLTMDIVSLIIVFCLVYDPVNHSKQIILRST